MNPALVGIVASAGRRGDISVLDEGFQSSSGDLSSYDISPGTIGVAGGSLVLVAIHHNVSAGTPNAASLSGDLTWNLVDSSILNQARVDVLRTWLAAPTAPSVTASFGAETQLGQVSVYLAATGVVNGSGDNGASCIVQTVDAGTASGTSHSLPLATFADSVNAGVGFFGIFANGSAGNGYTEINEGNNSPDGLRLHDQWRANAAGADPTVSWSGSLPALGVGLELAAS